MHLRFPLQRAAPLVQCMSSDVCLQFVISVWVMWEYDRRGLLYGADSLSAFSPAFIVANCKNQQNISTLLMRNQCFLQRINQDLELRELPSKDCYWFSINNQSSPFRSGVRKTISVWLVLVELRLITAGERMKKNIINLGWSELDLVGNDMPFWQA